MSFSLNEPWSDVWHSSSWRTLQGRLVRLKSILIYTSRLRCLRRSGSFRDEYWKRAVLQHRTFQQCGVSIGSWLLSVIRTTYMRTFLFLAIRAAEEGPSLIALRSKWPSCRQRYDPSICDQSIVCCSQLQTYRACVSLVIHKDVNCLFSW